MTKSKRPDTLPATVIKKTTGCGDMSVIIGHNGDGLAFEIFADLGKAGGCNCCHSEALTRSISLGLQHGVPASEYAEQLMGITCPLPIMFPKEERVLSCPDAISQALTSFSL